MTKGLTPIAIAIVHKVAANGCIERIEAGAGDVEHDEHDEIDERELFNGKGVGTVYDEEGGAHGKDHGKEHDAVQDAKD